MKKEIKNRIYEYLILTLVVLFYILFLRFFIPIFGPDNPEFLFKNDHYHYINMAREPYRQQRADAPFCYRILVPLIAWILPFDLMINFQIITYVSLYFISILLYLFFKNYYNKIFAYTGITLFFSLNWTVIYFLYNVYLVDLTAFLFILLCFWAIFKSNLKIFSISLLLGVLTKEIVLIMIPCLIIFNYKKEFSNFLKILLAILPGIIIFIILRVIIIPVQTGTYDYFYLLENVGFDEIIEDISKFDIRFMLKCTLYTWGLILCIFPFFNEEFKFYSWVRSYGIFIILIYFQLAIATHIQRLLSIGFFPMILLTLSGMNNLSQKKKIKDYYFLILSIIYFFFNLFLVVIFFEMIF